MLVGAPVVVALHILVVRNAFKNDAAKLAERAIAPPHRTPATKEKDATSTTTPTP